MIAYTHLICHFYWIGFSLMLYKSCFILLAALICAFCRLSHLSSRICACTLYVYRLLFQAKP